MPAVKGGFVELRERAHAFLVERGSAGDDEFLAHVFGGVPPVGLRQRLLAPLLGDPRLHHADGRWRLAAQAGADAALDTLCVTTLALATTGPRPSRHRVVQVAAVQVDLAQAASRSGVVGRFAAVFNPGKPGGRVPGYVARRTRLEPELAGLDDLPTFGDLLDDFLAFVADRPVCAQEAQTAWAFLEAEARRLGRTLAHQALIDFGDLADLALDLFWGKPTLSLVAERLGIGLVHVGQPEDEARALAEAVIRLLPLAQAAGLGSRSALERALAARPAGARPLRQAATVQALPDAPGVYELKNPQAEVLYVGKARRLRSRLQAYVHRPLAATRRLEGLADRVSGVASTVCATDLEALVLEDREIRRLRPRYNTQRQRRAPRVWLRLPPDPKRPRAAPPRLLLAEGPPGSGTDAVLGPFRNQAAAEAARRLVREVYDLDGLRRAGDQETYRQRLGRAWAFLAGAAEAADRAAQDVRSQLLAARAARDHAAARRLERLLARVLAYDPAALLLPADPRQARLAVVRPAPADTIDDLRVEVFVLDAARLVGHAEVHSAAEPASLADLLAASSSTLSKPRTEPTDRDVVLRWLGAQRPPARVVHLPADQPAAARAALAEAIQAVQAERSARLAAGPGEA